MKLKHLISNVRTKTAAIVAAGLLAGGISASAQSKYNADQQAEAAKGVIERFIGEGSGLTVNVSIDLQKASGDKDQFSYSYSGGILTVHASSGVAACRGFYDFVKSNGAGISSWSGKRFKMPTTVEHATKEFTSPYRDHQYLNVVTYGYSMPYWDEDRWMKELDWMALHGIDMPLMLLASESIYRDVFAAKGLSQSQIDEWEVGPAHLPWFRMGNLAGNSFDGPLGQNWHNRQKALAKAVLKRMGELGMKPVVPAFGGFVPKAYAEQLGSGNYVASGWGWMPQAYRNYRITPARSEFKEIGKNFIERWDAEFEDSYGTFQYYLSDSFNEMDVPSDLNLLASYGNQIYNAIKEGSGNNDAVWVTQGWEFVYGRSKWNASKYQALRRDVPAHHFMSLYMAPEYGGYQWNYYNNFYGDDWNYTMLPNMGGKNFWTGNLNDYAKSYPQALANGGAYSNCTGWGMTMEGIEYNELLYELISDMGWTNPTQGPDVQAWMEQYGANRYGSDVYDDEFKALHTALRNTVYSSYKDHQNFGWQGNNKSEGYYNAGNIDKTNDTFYAGFDRFFSSDNIAALKAKVQNGASLGETLRADLLEFAAFYAAARVEKICARIKVYNNMGKKDEANALIAELQNVMYDMDYALTGHPLYDEAKWEAKAEKMAETDQTETNHYVKNARRIVTTWYGEHGGHEAVNDYASRIYAGIIRDYYMPRLVAELNNLVNGQNNNLRQVELNFIPNKSGAAQVNALSVPKHVVDGQLVEVPGGMTLQNTPDDVLLDFVAKLVDDSREVGTLTVAKEKIVPSTDSKTQWYVISSNYDNYRDRVITVSGNASDKSASYTMQTVSGSKNQYWRFISTGDNTYRIESREGQVLSYDGGFKTYKYNINSDTQWDYNSDEVIYAFKPATASNWLHYADASKGFEFYGYKDNNGWYPGSTFTLETVNLSDDIVSETDYTRYRSRLEGYNTWFPGEYGQVGLPKNAEALTSTIAGFNKANNAGALTSITNFLEENWPTALNTAVDVPEEGTKARVLFDLMLGALDLPEGPDANAITTFRTALHSAQAALASGNESNCATQYTALQSAVKAYMNTVPNFPYASKAPQGGKFYEGSKVITMRCGNGNGYVTMNAMENEAFKLGNTTKPTTSAGYWVVSGDDANGYTFYNVQAGAGKVLGISGSGADARAKLYDANSVPSGVSYKFKYRLNANGAPVFYTGNNNAWNNRGGWLALWDSADAFGTDKGSGFTCEVVANADLGQTVGGEVTPPTGPTDANWTDANWTAAAFGTDVNAAKSKTNFSAACYYDFDNVTVEADGTVSATVKFVGGTHAQGFYGIELVKKDAPAASNTRALRAPSAVGELDDYAFAQVGTNGTKTYTVSNVPAGTYTVRVWSAATKGRETMTGNGTLEVKVNDTKVGDTYNWNSASWKIDDSLTPEVVKNDSNMPRIGLNLDGTGSYRYLDQEMTFDKATTLTTTVTSTDASKTMEIIGVELLQNNAVITTPGSYDGHYGTIGATTADNTYTLEVPAAGTYTVRVWASYVKNQVASAGTSTYALPEADTTPKYVTAPEIREKAATGRFAILGVTTTADHYINGEVSGQVSSDNTLAGVRAPEATEVVYFVSADNNQYYIQREDNKKYIKATTSGLSLVEGTTEATPFNILGKGDADYGNIGSYSDLFTDIAKEPNDLMIRFKNGNNWLNAQGDDKTGCLGSGAGAWSFEYVKYLGEQSTTPETPELFSSAKTYKFISKRNGVLYAPESDTSNDIVNTTGKGIANNDNDAHQQFAIIASPKFPDAYYLYSVEADKFLICPSTNNNTHWTLSATPVQYVNFVDNATNIESHPWFITATDYLNTDAKYYAHMGNGGNDWALITWSTADEHMSDAGNGWKVEEVGEFDPAKLQAALDLINLREDPTVVPDPLPLPETTSTVLGGLQLSSATEKHYYVIRNYSKSGDYAHYAGDAAKLSLSKNVDASAVFYFTQAEGAESTDGRAAIRIYNVGAEQKMMSGFQSWANAPETVWYVRKASQAEGTYNICPDANFGNNCWNHQSGGVWTYSADNGSAWYLESPAYSYEIAVSGTDDENAGITYLGQNYTPGMTVDAFSESASDFTPTKVKGMTAKVIVYHGTIYVDYEPANSFFADDAEGAVYRKIVFKANQNIAVNPGTEGNFLTTSGTSSAEGWAFIGSADSFKLLCQDGHYLGWKNGTANNNQTADLIYCTTPENAADFVLVDNGDGSYGIVRSTNRNQSFNCWGGMTTGKNVGFYDKNNDGSKLLFLSMDGTLDNPVLPAEEYAITGVESFAKPSQHTLWYTSPAPNTYYGWENFSLPLGNGELGGSIFGGVKTEKITFNEKSLWDGASTTRPNGPHGEYLKFGNIWVRDLSHNFDDGVKDYVRYLDIDNAVAGVQYSDAAGTHYTRTYVTSQPDKVMAIRYEADGDNKLNLNFTVIPGQFLRERSKGETPEVTYENGSATFNGRLELLSYAANVSVKADEGAEVISDYRGITVKNASEITVYYAGATDFNAWDNKSGNFVTGGAAQLPADMAQAVANASQKGFDAVLADAKDEYHSFYNRVKLDLKSGGSSVDTQKNTYDLVYDYTRDTNGIRETGEGYFLEQLYYNYGRYLLISSNRYAPVPNNLQGLWVDADYGDSSKAADHSPWNSDIHTNINIQMNYWPAEPNNLSELHEPLLNHIISIAESPGAKAQAQKMNSQEAIQANGNVTDASLGWVINTESNLFGGMSTFAENYTIANAWYCSHLWQHYRYTCDREFLKKAFPAMWGAAQYWVQRLVLSADGKTYECYNEWSPEHGPSENATAHSQQLVRELFDNVLEAVDILGDDANVETEWLDMIQERRSKLDLGLATEKYKSGNINGKNWNNLIPDDTDILREWKYSAYTVGENAHRHTSHLMALYPFGQVSFFSEEGSENYKLAEAARNSLTQRSDNSTGWAMGWRVNLWARALDGDHARRLINNALRCTGGGGIYYNLWDSHAPFQIDGNFGVCAGVSEMLLQSYDGTIHLLPALPTAWAEGSVSGLKAVGNFTVDQTWKDGKLTGADITSNKGGKLVVAYGKKKVTLENTLRGETYHFDIDANGDLTTNLVNATIVTITDYIDGAKNGTSYDAQKIEEYKNLILKLKK